MGEAKRYRSLGNVEKSPLSEEVVKACLKKVLKTLVSGQLEEKGPSSRNSGLYSGTTSVAYMFYSIYNLLGDEYEVEGLSLMDWSRKYLSLSEKHGENTSSLKESDCGIGNERMAYNAVAYCLYGDVKYVQDLLECGRYVVKHSKSNEWLYGRAGYLYFLRLCKNISESQDSDDLSYEIDKIAGKVIQAIMETPWEWRGKHYYGAVHGDIGIITQVTLTCALLDRTHWGSLQPKIISKLKTLLELSSLQEGWFPSSEDSSSGDKLVQFCHGAPGLVISLRSILPYFVQDKDLTAKAESIIVTTQDDIYRRGLLTKADCLCHGMSGNLLALEDPHQRQHYMQAICQYVDEQYEEPQSLYCGLAGKALVICTELLHMERLMPGYNDI
ncbi:lanthionine synthetase C-like protein [Gregarina niphandrodes]|uniref:Lanthionine synthetase C-like protein n=1 Tax=Gregarina niphandrodes TaxID=110365 RepID=A0A023B7U0_GRENI|nr:lanthionine synthetase C-like protein [Gregarina niphandrodes]EZG67890.1 lanthionine synthetase C-like protein [Gregarina niphandrodes]|eukprot:XP_011130138.1 lanthionine synthetase C-like protein [Gregarina niphandrodes]